MTWRKISRSKGRRAGLALILACSMTPAASATVFINEVFVNAPGGSESTKEFIELAGTPGMKLDGYAIALLNGAQRRQHPSSPIPPDCLDNPAITVCLPEVDEFFSLDGLRLGANGLLVIAPGLISNYPATLADTSFRADYDGSRPIWNGLLDTVGRLQNDGSNTIVLIRNRPGSTQATCPTGPCTDLRWGKDIVPDREMFRVMTTSCTSDVQFGNGNVDRGESSVDSLGCVESVSYATLDLKGASTLPNIGDDLEIIDELSYEHEDGWEYDEDDRQVNMGRTSGGLRGGNVHALGDPFGFNADCLTRVDYRTQGAGWPVPPWGGGGAGQLPGGNNWQDTATEQWVRGEVLQCISGCPGAGPVPQFFFDNAVVAIDPMMPDPDAIYDPANPGAATNQLYRTNVPLWLNDGAGTNYDFTTASSYQVMAGRVNPLAVPYIPGDSDRDGDADAADIAKLAAVFGNDNWVFSNGFEAAPESDSGDPAAQTRPWDVDHTGDNGIEPSDLQWTLNFMGNTDGRIVGRQYDSTVPSATGVTLNPSAGVTCTITASASNPCGRPLNALFIDDVIEVIVRAQVTGGANTTSGQENGVMQFVHDAIISSGGVLQFVSAQPLGAFSKTRAAYEAPQGTGGELGVRRLNGYSTSFTQGLAGPAELYKLTFRAQATGSVSITVGAAAEAKLAASTPRGVKLGHTANITADPPPAAPAPAADASVVLNRIRVENGDPVSAAYPAPISITVGATPLGDVNIDGLRNFGDVLTFVNVLLGVDTDPQRVLRSDVNCDTRANGLDIQPFIDLLLP